MITFGIATHVRRPEREKWLHECIQSITAQTNPHWRLIVSDDHSPIKVDYSAYEGHPQVRILRPTERLTMFNNFNHCLANTETEWFVPMGDDDLVGPNFVRETRAYLESLGDRANSLGLLHFNYYHIDLYGKSFFTSQIPMETTHAGMHALNVAVCMLHGNTSVEKMFFCAIMRTKTLQKLGGYPDYGTVTDLYLSYLFALHLDTVVVPHPIMSIRQHPFNSSRLDIDTALDERDKLIPIVLEQF